MRVFLDTNVLVSAFASHGLCTDLLGHVLADHELITGEVILTELKRALREKIKLPQSTITAIENELREQLVVPRPAQPYPLTLRDASDEWVIASAVAGNADVLVTGDAGLLQVADRAPIPIVSPREFWDMLRAGSGANRT